MNVLFVGGPMNCRVLRFETVPESYNVPTVTLSFWNWKPMGNIQFVTYRRHEIWRWRRGLDSPKFYTVMVLEEYPFTQALALSLTEGD